jgi:hypothetical protein
MKNAIFEASNVKLIRIRVHSIEEMSVQHFQSLVLKMMR